MPVRSTTAPTPLSTAEQELDRQLDLLVDKGFPTLAGLTPQSFRELADPLREQARTLEPTGQGLPFVVVVQSSLVPPSRSIPTIDVRGKQGWTEMTDEELATFVPLSDVDVPASPLYLVLDVDAGAPYLDVRPKDALPVITASGRSVLTVDEGIAVMVQHPELMTEQNAFSLLGSRSHDKRVTAMWRSKGSPRLGWCFQGAPHTWLGSATCAGRL